MTFQSILHQWVGGSSSSELREPPDFFVDLNLDQVINAITLRKQAYDLNPFFYTALTDPDTIYYRHEVMRDLESEALLADIRSFAQKMITLRRYLGLESKLQFDHHREGWFLEAAIVYCDAVEGLAGDLRRATVRSRGLVAFRDYVTDCVSSDSYLALAAQARRLRADLSAVRYSVSIREGTVKVRAYDEEEDYTADVERTFERFRQGAVKNYGIRLSDGAGMNHVEAQILDCVARLHADLFARLTAFREQHSQFVDDTICRFDREVQFYVAYLEFTDRLKRAGLRFCYPRISEAREVHALEAFDLALANKLVMEKRTVVCNDFHLQGKERIFVVSGPNQGGKTTFARMFGQLHYLASLGCPVPGSEASLYLYDSLFTHFEREEDIRNLRGKLQDDLVRIHAVLEQATPRSVLVMNEIFSSTTLGDAVFLSREIMEQILDLDLLCVWVTFVDELASCSEKTVSMVSTVVPDNPALRTFKIERKPADGLAYALSIAEKHLVTYEHILERISL